LWALRDISFDIKRGESVGLIGLNGSGKTTLLRLIHGIFPPDRGEIMMRGRVGALIALGAGFHPHLTGRENIFLNGSILGISQRDIRARLDEIIEFAEIGEFMDAPVSTYSSGMRVRLGFAVAVNMNPDILLIDEVLAVGDLGFRNKCYLCLKKLLSANKTIVFVSHNMGQVEHVCGRALLLDAGQIVKDGSSGSVVAEYYGMIGRRSAANEAMGRSKRTTPHVYETGEVQYLGCSLRMANREIGAEVRYGDTVAIDISIQVNTHLVDPLFYVVFQTIEEFRNVAFVKRFLNGTYKPGRYTVRVRMPSLLLMPGVYRVASRIKHADGIRKLAGVDELMAFTVIALADQFPKTTEAGYLEIPGECCMESSTS
jgi:lipopolysaccharide transport system ATP-binding protein